MAGRAAGGRACVGDANRVAVPHLAADIERELVAGGDAGFKLDHAAVVARDRHVDKVHLALRVDARDLRATAAEQQSRSRHLNQAFRRQAERNLDVHSGQQSLVAVRDVDLEAHGARLRIDRAGRAADRRADIDTFRRTGFDGHGLCRLQQLRGDALRHVDEDAERVVLRHLVQRRRRARAACRDEIADVNVSFRDDAVERRDDLLELRERRVLLDVSPVEGDLGLSRLQVRDGAVVVSLLLCALLLGHHPRRRVSPAVVRRAGELGITLARQRLRLGRAQLRPRGEQLGVELRRINDGEYLALSNAVADVGIPAADVAVHPTVDRAREPCRGLARQRQGERVGHRLRLDDVHRARRRLGRFGSPFEAVVRDEAEPAHENECHDQHDRRDLDGALHALVADHADLIRVRRGRTNHVFGVVGLAHLARPVARPLLALVIHGPGHFADCWS